METPLVCFLSLCFFFFFGISVGGYTIDMSESKLSVHGFSTFTVISQQQQLKKNTQKKRTHRRKTSNNTVVVNTDTVTVNDCLDWLRKFGFGFEIRDRALQTSRKNMGQGRLTSACFQHAILGFFMIR